MSHMQGTPLRQIQIWTYVINFAGEKRERNPFGNGGGVYGGDILEGMKRSRFHHLDGDLMKSPSWARPVEHIWNLAMY